MHWLNLHVSVLDSPEFLGAEPIERATWLCLLRYCIGQENGGRILECSEWGDRKWQQLCRVTLKEVRVPSELWHWEEFNLTVSYYPVDQEKVVLENRAQGHTGGRPKKPAKKPPGSEKQNPPVIENETPRLSPRNDRSGINEGFHNPPGVDRENVREGEGKVKKGKGREGNANGTAMHNGSATAVIEHKADSLTSSIYDLAPPGQQTTRLARFNVLKAHRVTWELGREPNREDLRQEWDDQTHGQCGDDINRIFAYDKTIKLPSEYKRARQKWERGEV